MLCKSIKEMSLYPISTTRLTEHTAPASYMIHDCRIYPFFRIKLDTEIEISDVNEKTCIHISIFH